MPKESFDTRDPRGPGRIGLILFLWFALFYLLTTSGHIFTPDGTLMYLVTEGLVERGDPALPTQEGDWSFWHTEIGRDGRRYAIYGLGPSLAAVPFYLLGRGVAEIAPATSEPVFQRPLKLFHPREFNTFVRIWGVSLTNAIVAAGVVWLLYAVSLTLGLGRGTSLALAFILGAASPLWHYSKTFFGEPMSALALLLFLYLMLKHRQDASSRSLFWAGVALSAALLIKAANAVFLAAALPFAAVLVWTKQDRLRHLATLGLGLISLFPIILYYNAYRFGTIFETGYSSKIDFTHPFLSGVIGLLISPGRGLFLYFPLALLSLVVLILRWKRDRALSVFLFSMLLIPALFHAKWWSWEGGWCWGPRFFVPVLPLLVLPLGYWIDERRDRPTGAWIVLVVAVLSAVIAFSGILVSFNDYYSVMKAHYGILRSPYYPDMRWAWQWSPLLQYWGFEHKNFFLATTALSTPAGRFWQVGFGVLAILWIGTTGLLWRERNRD